MNPERPGTENVVETVPRRGLMFILSSPSGAGKTTLARRLLDVEGTGLRMSVSVTTRGMRPGEIDGRDYHFVTRERFDTLVEQGAFLEWAQVFGNCYGTPRGAIAEGLARGHDYLFDVDWQGARQLSDSAGKDVVSLFLLPPSIAELEQRLRARATDTEAVIADRMARARAEISHWDSYDYVIVNRQIDRCFADVRAILGAERLRRTRQTGLADFTRDLVG